MSLIRALHFDTNSLPSAVGTIGANPPILSSTIARTGTYSVRAWQYSGPGYTFAQYMSCSLLGSYSEIFLQFGMYMVSTAETDNGHFLRWKDSSNNVLGGLFLNVASKLIDVYTGNFATKVATGTHALDVNTWQVIEAHIVIGDSGSITTRVGTTTDATFTGDTQPGAGTSIASFDLAGPHLSLNITGYTYFDDIIINDASGSYNNSWPNAAKVFYLPLIGDGATKQWSVTPAGLTHYTAIDDIPPSATDFIRANTTNLVDIFTVTDLPSTVGSIKAVIPEVYAFKGSSVEPTKLGIGIDVGGGVEYVSKDLSVSQSFLNNVWDQKPGGGNFSSADVNALQLYLKSLP